MSLINHPGLHTTYMHAHVLTASRAVLPYMQVATACSFVYLANSEVSATACIHVQRLKA